MIYMVWSLKKGSIAGPNPWEATGLEWQTPSPPPPSTIFYETPAVNMEPYYYGELEGKV